MKKVSKILLATLLITFSLFSLTACDKLYEVNGLIISMDDSFEVVQDSSLTVYMENDDVYFMALEENYQLLESQGIEYLSVSASQYAQLIIAKNDYNVVSKTINGYAYFDFEKVEDGVNYYNYIAVLKGSNGFWTCRFMCEASKKDKYAEKFEKWAKTIIV